jgi:hypothetical protein
MSHLQGYVTATYAELVALFGPSQCWDDYKSDAEWEFEIPGIGTATIYNYKDGRNYLGDEGKPKEEITDWHIGGDTDAVVKPIQQAVATLRSEGRGIESRREPIRAVLERNDT